jgi:hypothetical protein
MRLNEKARNIAIGVAATVALGTYVYIEDRPAPRRKKPLLKPTVTLSSEVTIGTPSKPEGKQRRRERERP